ncbi:MAG: glycine/D-amino acid oxidase-like deaminating enzyme [Bacteriovoracaceae bacterium]|jgi:gamma-glutamylputrescine oxidase
MISSIELRRAKMSVSIWQDRKKLLKKVDQSFDVVIVGGGIAGLSTAYWILKENQGLKIALVEKSQIGDGATGRNAGFITCGSVEHFNRLIAKHGKKEALEIWNFSEKNLELLQTEIINGHEEDLEFEKKGSFSLASSKEELVELNTSYKIMRELGIEVEFLNQTQVEDRLGASEFVGGVKYSNDASIHPLKLSKKILSMIEKSPDFTLLENHEVFSIVQDSDKKRLHTKGGNLVSSIVILATNGYSPQLNEYFKDKIFPTRGQILATAPVPRFMEGPCYANFVLDYFRQLPTGELVIGGFRQLQKDVEIGYSDEISDIIQNALQVFLKTHIPKLRDVEITHRWSGIMGFSVDGQPLVGSLPTDNQTFFVGGFTAHGLGLAFHSAKCLTDSIFGRPIPPFISAKRF